MSIAAKCTCGSSLNGICNFSNDCPQLVPPPGQCVIDQNGRPLMSYEDWKALHGKGGMPPLAEPIISGDDMGAWEESKLTPEQIEERKKAIEWYRGQEVQQGAVWVNVESKLPIKGQTVLVEYRSRDLEYKVYTGLEDWWKRNIRRWLNESPVKDDWISVDERLPEIGEYVLVYNTELATLVGALMRNGWIALFADGQQLMGELTATHWRPLLEPPKTLL